MFLPQIAQIVIQIINYPIKAFPKMATKPESYYKPMQGPGQVAGSRKLLSKEALDKVKRELEALKEIYMV